MLRLSIATLSLAAVVAGGLAVAALVAWPQLTLRSDGAALSRVSLAGYAGTVSGLRVTEPDGVRVPVALRNGRVWPLRALAPGERLTVAVTVSRPSWVGWLVGAHSTRRFTVTTPAASLRGTWLQVARGAPVVLGFDQPVSRVEVDGKPAPLLHPSARVASGRVASGADAAGSLTVAAAARSWERLSSPLRVTWFPALAEPQVLASPRPGSTISPGGALRLVFSTPVSQLLGSALPVLSPATPGHWQRVDAHTLTFTPSGGGFGLGADVRVTLPRPVIIAGRASTQTTLALGWQVPLGTTLRLQQLLAELGYLPLDWSPSGSPVPQNARQELAAALNVPRGHFSWRYPNTPAELEALWSPGQPNTITRGAVMMFEHDNDLAVDGIAGPIVWRTLIADVLSGRTRQDGYDYVYVHRDVPQSLNLWVDGHTILSSPGNTGVPAAPTALGTFPVFEHITIGTMKGTNPDGTRYDDPGIRWISYFHGGDAIHTFNRASYGTPQSLGCVELPLAAAAKVWPYTPIGTLVTIEQ